MNIAIKLAAKGQLPCEGYPIKAITIEGTSVPIGYDQVVSLDGYKALKASLEAKLVAYQKTLVDDSIAYSYIVDRCNLELTMSDWRKAADVSEIGYEKKVAWLVYRQLIRDILEQPKNTEIVWPSRPTNELLVTVAKPVITESNREAWTGLLWKCCEEFKYDKMNEDATTGIGLKAALTQDAKAVAIQSWLTMLWFAHYTPRKEALLRGEEVSFDFKTGNSIPYPVWDVLNG